MSLLSRITLAAVVPLTLAACARTVRETSPVAATPAPEAPAAPALVPTAETTTSPPPERRPVAPPMVAQQLGLMPLASAGVTEFRQLHPTYDGRGVLIAILDSGTDPGVPGLQTTTLGERKILDLRDFSGEGRVSLAPVRADAMGRIAVEGGITLLGAGAVRAVATDSAWYGGLLSELPFGGKPEADFNGNGSNRDRFGVVVVRGASGWLAFVDSNGDGSLSDETAVADYLVRAETFTFSSRFAPRGRGPITAALNLTDESGRPVLTFYLDTSGHGTHTAGIAAAHDMYGVRGFDGVAPGARIIALKIANNARGGVTTNGSMLGAMEYAVRFAEERRLPLVMNVSFGIGNEGEPHAVMDSIVNAFLIAHPNVVFAISAGNDGPGTSTMGLPGSAELALTSGAVYPGAFAPAQFNAASPDVLGWWGARGGELAKPDIVTPGLAYSTVPRYNTGSEIKLGTSMASPYAAGLVALLVSAMAQEGRTASAAELTQALRATARRFAGESAIDQGAGVPRVEAAYQWLRAGHAVVRYRVQALPPAREARPGRPIQIAQGSDGDVGPAREAVRPTAAYRRNGLASSADTVQRFRVSRLPGRTGPRTEGYRLYSDAAWLRPAQPTVTVDSITGSAVVEVRYDASRITRAGRYVGTVYGISEADTAAGQVFVLANTVIVTDSVMGRVMSVGGRKLPAGSAARYYLTVPPSASGLSLRLSLRDTTTPGSFFLFEPSGRPARGADRADVGREDGSRATLRVNANDIVPGVWEAVVQALPARDVTFDLQAAVPSVRIAAVDSTSGTPGIVFASSAAQETTLTVTAEHVGALTAWVAEVERGETYRREFEAPAWATKLIVEAQLSPETWNQVTDFVITVFDREGAQLGNGAMNYDYHRVGVDLPARRNEPFRVAVELFPGFAMRQAPARVDAGMRVTFVGAPRPALQGSATMRIPAGGTADLRVNRNGGYEIGPGWVPLVRVRASARADDWVVIESTFPMLPR
ncbi:MAG: S8 family serine peptidase [Gemmatimonadota bacterium]